MPFATKVSERFRFAGAQRQREHVPDVRRIETGIRIRERIGVHVADARQHAAPRAQHVRGGPCPDGPRIGSSTRRTFCIIVTKLSA